MTIVIHSDLFIVGQVNLDNRSLQVLHKTSYLCTTCDDKTLDRCNESQDTYGIAGVIAGRCALYPWANPGAQEGCRAS